MKAVISGNADLEAPLRLALGCEEQSKSSWFGHCLIEAGDDPNLPSRRGPSQMREQCARAVRRDEGRLSLEPRGFAERLAKGRK